MYIRQSYMCHWCQSEVKVWLWKWRRLGSIWWISEGKKLCGGVSLGLKSYFLLRQKIILDSPTAGVIFSIGEKSRLTKQSITTTFTSKDGSCTSRLSIADCLLLNISAGFRNKVSNNFHSYRNNYLSSVTLVTIVLVKLSDFWQMQSNIVPHCHTVTQLQSYT